MKLYAICNDKNEFYTKSSWKSIWAADLNKARIYARKGSATAQITYLAKYYQKTLPVPALVVLEANIVEVVPQTKRVKEAFEAKERKEKERKKRFIEDEIIRKQNELRDLMGK